MGSEAAGTIQNRTGRLIPDDVWGILCCYAEARNQPYDGIVAVGNVIRERMKRRMMSDGSVVFTVLAPYQYSWTNTTDGQRTHVFGASWESPRMDECARAWFESEHRVVVPEATHYYADSIPEPWWARANHMVYVAKIGNHVFFREQVVA